MTEIRLNQWNRSCEWKEISQVKEKAMALNKEQEETYKKAMNEAKKELDGVDSKMQEEIQKARQKLADLQESKKHYRQIYEGTALLLGLEVESEEKSELPQAEQATEEKEGEDDSDKAEAAQAQSV
jgi:ABC-type Zn uptake system ZnuABC Zn-binding protein ZnuA